MGTNTDETCHNVFYLQRTRFEN